jgi:hypothetical protein
MVSNNTYLLGVRQPEKLVCEEKNHPSTRQMAQLASEKGDGRIISAKKC